MKEQLTIRSTCNRPILYGSMKKIRTLKLLLIVALAMTALCASGMASAADYRGGGQSGGSYKGGQSGGSYRGGGQSGGSYKGGQSGGSYRGGGQSGGSYRGGQSGRSYRGGGQSGGYYGGQSGRSYRGGGYPGRYYRGGGQTGRYYRGGGYSRGYYGGYSGRYYRGGGYYWGGYGGPYWGSSWYYPFYYPYYYSYYSPYYYPYSTPYYYPYNYPYSYSYPYTVPSTPQEYVEPPQAEPPSEPSDVWYYCPQSRKYYPYVRECPGGWQTVPAQPPSSSSQQPTAKVIDRMTVRVNFDVNQATIRPDDRAVIDEAVDFVKKYPDARIELDGYTDSRGTEAYNQRLSEKRAGAVKQYLIREAGVDPSRISAVGRGESNPVADNNTEEGRFENRRVEILILQE
jgi:outer membrane protein OmpA-like peptidoglycan-associated protein